MSLPRFCYIIPHDAKTPLGYLPSMVYENESGHYPMTGSGDCQKVAFNPVGQVVGQINSIESCRDIMYRLLTEYSEALDHINTITPQE